MSLPTSPSGPPMTERTVYHINECVQLLKRDFSDRAQPITDDATALHRLCFKLEFILQSDFKDGVHILPFNKRKTYWHYFCNCLASNKQIHEGLKFVKSIQDLKTPVGKGRAFLRFCLMQKSLADTLQQCVSDETKTKNWYNVRSPLVRKDLYTKLIGSLYELNDVSFDLVPPTHDLDIEWPTASRKGIFNEIDWRVPSRSVSLSSLNSSCSARTDRSGSCPREFSNHFDRLENELGQTRSILQHDVLDRLGDLESSQQTALDVAKQTDQEKWSQMISILQDEFSKRESDQKEKLSELQSKNDELTINIAELECQRFNGQEEIDECKAKIHELIRENDRLRYDRQANSEELSEELDRVKADFVRIQTILEDTKREFDRKIHDTLSENERLKAENEEATIERSTLVEQIKHRNRKEEEHTQKSAVEPEREDLSNAERIKGQQNLIEELEGVRRERDDLVVQVGEFKGEGERWKEEKQVLLQKLKQLTLEKEEAEGILIDNKQQCRTLTVEKVNMEERMELLENESSLARAHFDKLFAEEKALQFTIEDEKKALMVELEAARAENQDKIVSGSMWLEEKQRLTDLLTAANQERDSTTADADKRYNELSNEYSVLKVKYDCMHCEYKAQIHTLECKIIELAKNVDLEKIVEGRLKEVTEELERTRVDLQDEREQREKIANEIEEEFNKNVALSDSKTEAFKKENSELLEKLISLQRQCDSKEHRLHAEKQALELECERASQDYELSLEENEKLKEIMRSNDDMFSEKLESLKKEFTTKSTSLTNEKAAAEKRIEELAKENSLLVDQVAALNKKMEDELKLAAISIEGLQQEVVKVKQEMNHVVNTLNLEKENLKLQIENANQSVGKTRLEIERKMADAEKNFEIKQLLAEQKITEFERDFIEVTNQKQAVVSEKIELSEENKKLMSKLGELEFINMEQSERVRQTAAEFENKMASLIRTVNSLQMESRAMESENNRLKFETKKLNAIETELEIYKDKHDTACQQIQSLQLYSSQLANEATKTNVGQLKEEFKGKERELVVAIDKLRYENTQLNEQIFCNEQQLSEVNLRNEKLVRELNSLNNRVLDLEDNLTACKSSFASLDDSYKERLLKQQQDNGRLEKEVEFAESTFNDLANEIAAQQEARDSEVEELTRELRQAIYLEAEEDAEPLSISEGIKHLQNQKLELIVDLENYRVKNCNIEEQLLDCQNELEKLQSHMQNECCRNKKLLDDLNFERDDLLVKMAATEESIKKAEIGENQMASKIVDLENLEHELESSRRALDSLNLENQVLLGKIEQLETSANQLTENDRENLVRQSAVDKEFTPEPQVLDSGVYELEDRVNKLVDENKKLRSDLDVANAELANIEAFVRSDSEIYRQRSVLEATDTTGEVDSESVADMLKDLIENVTQEMESTNTTTDKSYYTPNNSFDTFSTATATNTHRSSDVRIVENMSKDLQEAKSSNRELTGQIRSMMDLMRQVEKYEDQLQRLESDDEASGSDETATEEHGEDAVDAVPTYTRENCTDLMRSTRKTIERLQTLVYEKKRLQRELGASRDINSNLQTRVQEQEARLSNMTFELNKTQAMVTQLSSAHGRLQTSEAILRYELKEKRKMLDSLKVQLEKSRSTWQRVRQKNSESEIEWKSLRAEFASRHSDSSAAAAPGVSSQERERSQSPTVNESPESPTSPTDSEIFTQVVLPVVLSQSETLLNTTDDVSLVNDGASTSGTPGNPVGRDRLKMLEDQCRLLYSKLVASSKRTEMLHWKLVNLHEHYQGEGDAAEGEGVEGAQESGVVDVEVQSSDEAIKIVEPNFGLQTLHVDIPGSAPVSGPTSPRSPLTTPTIAVVIQKPSSPLALARMLNKQMERLRVENEELKAETAGLKEVNFNLEMQDRLLAEEIAALRQSNNELRFDMSRVRAETVSLIREVDVFAGRDLAASSPNLTGTVSFDDETESEGGASNSASSVSCLLEDSTVLCLNESEIKISLANAGESLDSRVHLSPVLTLGDIEEWRSERELWLFAEHCHGLPILVDRDSVVILWEFYTEPQGVAFSLFYQGLSGLPTNSLSSANFDGNATNEGSEDVMNITDDSYDPPDVSSPPSSSDGAVIRALVTPNLCESQKRTMCGNLATKKAGVYTLIFDNSFSRNVVNKVILKLRVRDFDLNASDTTDGELDATASSV